MKRLATLSIAGLVACTAAIIALAAPAQTQAAVTGAIGTFNHVQATCYLGGRIVVTSPTMTPSYNIAFAPNGAIIIDPTQWVRFRVHVARWNGASWVRYASGPWKAAQVNLAGNNIADTWLNLDTNRWEAGTRDFPIYARGYYKVYAEYYWYPQYGYPDGYVGPVWTPYHAAAGTYMGSGAPWCQF